MIKINGISVEPKNDKKEKIGVLAASKLGVKPDKLNDFTIIKRSVDARKKDSVRIRYTVAVSVDDEKRFLRGKDEDISLYQPKEYILPERVTTDERPLIVGSGPAGLLAAMTLAQCGVRPILIERGEPVELRRKKIEAFFAGGELDENSNVQFGEGGAGTFSDGKLTTGIKDIRIGKVLSEFIEAGAPEDIAYDGKPHIGTDILITMVAGLRKKLLSLGVDIRFGTKLENIITENGHLIGAVLSNGEKIACSNMILATGHSARDTFEMLYENGVDMEQKAFSVGARIEHPQELINRAQYGDYAKYLEAADYKLSEHLPSGRGVYTFCMCPGGKVVAAASEKNAIATNGMSFRARDGENANSALLVGVEPSDFGSEHPLAGMELQRKIEHAAFEASGDYRATAQTVGDLLAGKPSEKQGTVTPSYAPGVRWGSMTDCLPDFVAEAMKDGIKAFGRKIKGFDMPDAVLTAPETRSSSPVRIKRDESLQSNIRGIYPCGEGAGYAGGIMSAAVDGIKCAEKIIESLR